MFFFNDTATTEIYTLSLHDALPIFSMPDSTGAAKRNEERPKPSGMTSTAACPSPSSGAVSSSMSRPVMPTSSVPARSEEHTSELQSRQYLVCRLLLEKKNIRLWQSQ